MATSHFLQTESARFRRQGHQPSGGGSRCECNVADIITRGAAPEELSEDSPWQKGPGFLEKPFEEWPVKSAAEVAADARESVNKLKRKAFSGALSRAQANVRTGKVNQSLTEPARDSRIRREPASGRQV
ncbi:hypothetical protein AAFF_G00145450 [Aldrovandia affinis]|uniref:Uncharacterized protein n=1 Tax=Aldrovandia affinis TaxID=143900 RepID=A0AAD7T1H0_9TELE|nr:hypothetical protein AAFF_G00145450 [Aldrovandia affinis]